MNLLDRIHNVLGTSRGRRHDPSWLAGAMAVGCSVAVVVAIGIHSNSGAAFAQERDGRRSPEAEAGDRPSPEAEDRRRRSPEADATRRRPAEGQRGDQRGREANGRSAIGGFNPQTPREAALLQMIVELQREVDALRREVRSRGGSDGDANPRYEGDRRSGDAALSADQFELPANWERTKEGRVFKADDKNGDESAALDEWLAMSEGDVDSARRQIISGQFNNAEPSGDGKFTPAEFIWWRRVGSRHATERAPGGRARDGAGPQSGGPRDGNRAVRRGPRDGEGPAKVGPRDGDRGQRSPADAEGGGLGPRDGDRE